MLRADVSDAAMLLMSFPCEAASVGVYGLVVGIYFEPHRCTLPCGSPFRCRRQRLVFPFSTTKKHMFSSMVRISQVYVTILISSTLLRRRRWLAVS